MSRGTHLGDAATQEEVTADDDLEEEVEENEDIERRKTSKLTASEDDTSDNDLLTELSESRTHAAAPENVTVDNSNEHGPKNTGDPSDLAKGTGQDAVAAIAPLRRTQRIRIKTWKCQDF